MFEKYLKSCCDIIKINSVQSEPLPNAPFGKGVKDALKFALSQAEKLGFSTKDGDGYYGFAEIGEGELFGMLGHLDTVPIGEDWSYPPLAGEVIDGFLVGRGVLDNKAPIMACLYAVKDLLDQGKVPKQRIRVIFGCNEESGWKCMDRYLEREEIPKLAFTPDADFPLINCEKGVVYHNLSCKMPYGVIRIFGGDRPNMVMDKCVAELVDISKNLKNMCIAKGLEINGNQIIARGVSAHGSTPQKGDNAFWKIIDVLKDEFGGEWLKICNIITNTDGSGYGIKLSDSVSGNLTVNIGTAKTEDGNLNFSLDIRHPISFTKDQITHMLQENLLGFNVSQGAYHNPLYIAPEHPLCSQLLQAYKSVTGEDAQPISIGGATYARALPTAVAFGPIFPNQESTIHQKDERVSLENLKKMYEVLKKGIELLCFE